MRLRDAVDQLEPQPNFPRARGRRVAKARPGEVQRPGLAVWEYTLACDHGCLHCGPRAGTARNDELSTQERLQLVADLAQIGVGEVVLIGGEAYLENDLPLIVREIRMRAMACSLTTAGLNLSQARLDALVLAGLQNVNVSIDGLEASHDRVRARPGSWQAAMAALDRVANAPIQLSVNTQLNALDLHDLLPLLERLASKGVQAWQLHPTAAHGNAADHPEILLQPYMYLELYEVLERVLDRADELGVRIWPGNGLGYFGPLESRLRGRQRSCGYFNGCNAGRQAFGIESNGAIKACPSLGGATNIAGSWREHGLSSLWNTAPQLTYFRVRDRSDMWGYCGECYYADQCKAGCTANAEPLLGRPGNNPMCYHRAREMDRMGLRERVERVHAPETNEPFAMGRFRVVREHANAELRAQSGPVAIEEPRSDRIAHPRGRGEALDGLRRVSLPILS